MQKPQQGDAIMFLKPMPVFRTVRSYSGNFPIRKIDTMPAKTVVLVWKRSESPDMGPEILWNETLWTCVWCLDHINQGIWWKYLNKSDTV